MIWRQELGHDSGHGGDRIGWSGCCLALGQGIDRMHGAGQAWPGNQVVEPDSTGRLIMFDHYDHTIIHQLLIAHLL